jgi:polyhydroxyalkanoate synthase
VVLIIPAPIKRAYIWDLLPRVSAVQEFVRSGAHVYLIQWEEPGAREQEFGLAEYADRLIGVSLQTIEKEVGRRRVVLAGHSLGGTFAAIFAALHPGLVAGLILLGAPLHFEPEQDVFSALVATSPSARVMTLLPGKVSGSFLSSISLAASPATFAFSRCRDWLASLSDSQALETYLRAERWTYDEMPLPRRLFEEVVDWLYRDDRLMRGVLQVGKRRVGPELILAPLLNVVETNSTVVPPESARPFYDAVRSRNKRWLCYEGDIGVCLQHLGLLVGRNAHQRLWPQIVCWTWKQWASQQ